MDDPRSSFPAWKPLVLLTVAGIVFFLRLDCALLEPEEARYAEIPREMLAANEWVVPQVHGQPYYDKPPLVYWLVMLSYSAFGVHDWAARLVPGCCGVLTVLFVYLWGRRVFGCRAAFLGALILTLTPRFVYLGRWVATDAPLSLSVVVALGCAHVAMIGPRLRWSWWLIAGFAVGIGLLAKGPAAFVLVGVPILAYLLMNARAARPGIGAALAFLFVAVATACPWYIAVMLRDPNFAEYFFWKHHVLRYLAPFDHAKPFWFYLPDFFAGTLPWALLLVPIARAMWKQRSQLRGRQPPEFLFPLLAAFWCVLFFSLSGSKRAGYVLPAFGPLALVFGERVDCFLTRFQSSRARTEWMPALASAALLMGGVGAVGSAIFGYCALPIALSIATAFSVLAIAVFVRRRQSTPKAGFAICAGVVFAESIVGIGLVLPEYAERFSLRREVLAAQSATPTATGVVCYPRGWDSVSFYLKRDDVVVFSENQRAEATAYLRAHPETLLFLRDGDASRKLLEELPSPLIFKRLGKQGNTLTVRVYHHDAPALAARDR